MGMIEITCLLCAVMSLLCALLLIRGYQRDHTKLLLWSSLCFAGLAINNLFLFVDLVLLPHYDFWGSLVRSGIGAISGIILLYGLTWELT